MYDKIIDTLDDDIKCCTKCKGKFKYGDIIITGISNYSIVCYHRSCLDQPLMSRTTYKYESKQLRLF